MRRARDAGEPALSRLHVIAITRPRRLRRRRVSDGNQVTVAAVVDVYVVHRRRTTTVGRRWHGRVHFSGRRQLGCVCRRHRNERVCLHDVQKRGLRVTVMRIRNQRFQRTDRDA